MGDEQHLANENKHMSQNQFDQKSQKQSQPHSLASQKEKKMHKLLNRKILGQKRGCDVAISDLASQQHHKHADQKGQSKLGSKPTKSSKVGGCHSHVADKCILCSSRFRPNSNNGVRFLNQNRVAASSGLHNNLSVLGEDVGLNEPSYLDVSIRCPYCQVPCHVLCLAKLFLVESKKQNGNHHNDGQDQQAALMGNHRNDSDNYAERASLVPTSGRCPQCAQTILWCTVVERVREQICLDSIPKLCFQKLLQDIAVRRSMP